MRSSAASVAVLAAVIAALGCAARRGDPVAREASFPVRIERAKLIGRTLSVKYVLTNDSPAPVWVACPVPECAPGAGQAGIFADGGVVDVSTRVEAPAWRSTSSPMLVPFRRVAPGVARWEARYELPSASTGGRAPGEVHLAIGILPCGAESLPRLVTPGARCEPAAKCAAIRRAEASGVRFATGDTLVCAGREERVLDVQRVSRAAHQIGAERL